MGNGADWHRLTLNEAIALFFAYRWGGRTEELTKEELSDIIAGNEPEWLRNHNLMPDQQTYFKQITGDDATPEILFPWYRLLFYAGLDVTQGQISTEGTKALRIREPTLRDDGILYCPSLQDLVVFLRKGDIKDYHCMVTRMFPSTDKGEARISHSGGPGGLRRDQIFQAKPNSVGYTITDLSAEVNVYWGQLTGSRNRAIVAAKVSYNQLLVPSNLLPKKIP